MNDTLHANKIRRLHELYERDVASRRFFDWAASRQRDSADTDVDRISSVAKITRYEALTLLRALKEIDVGNIIVGRRGAKTRIRWHYSLKSVGLAARDSQGQLNKIDPDELETLPAQDTPNNSNDIGVKADTIQNVSIHALIPHTKWLRPGMLVEINLPPDLTELEAAQLSAWITSIPFKTV